MLHLALQSSKIFKASSAFASSLSLSLSLSQILGDGTQELTTIMTDKLQEELVITVVSFAPVRAVAQGGATEVVARVTTVVEEKITLTLLLVLLLFLCLYCNHNRNT
jgi:hypothetical protein